MTLNCTFFSWVFNVKCNLYCNFSCAVLATSEIHNPPKFQNAGFYGCKTLTPHVFHLICFFFMLDEMLCSKWLHLHIWLILGYTCFKYFTLLYCKKCPFVQTTKTEIITMLNFYLCFVYNCLSINSNAL